MGDCDCGALWLFLWHWGRLFLWHYLQPIMAAIIVWAYSDLMDEVQFVLACIFLLRDAVYFVGISCTAFYYPAFLLFEPRRADWTCYTEYVLFPEKIVVGSLRGMCYSPKKNVVGWVPLPLIFADLCGVGAFVYGLAHRQMWLVLGITYSINILSLLSFSFQRLQIGRNPASSEVV